MCSLCFVFLVASQSLIPLCGPDCSGQGLMQGIDYFVGVVLHVVQLIWQLQVFLSAKSPPQSWLISLEFNCATVSLLKESFLEKANFFIVLHCFLYTVRCWFVGKIGLSEIKSLNVCPFMRMDRAKLEEELTEKSAVQAMVGLLEWMTGFAGPIVIL